VHDLKTTINFGALKHKEKALRKNAERGEKKMEITFSQMITK
jgi:hypothetical protein